MANVELKELILRIRRLQPYPCRYCARVFYVISKREAHHNFAHGREMQILAGSITASDPSGTEPKTPCLLNHSSRPPEPKLVALQRKDKPFECLTCGLKFSLQNYIAHRNNTHCGRKRVECSISAETRRGEWQCSICAETFDQKTDLTQHLALAHSGEKPFECSICGKTFWLKATLNTHMESHSRGRPFGCLVCGKTYLYKRGLDTHMVTHSGEKPFQCSICRKTFLRKATRNRHTLIHSGEKPFQCSICHKTFLRNEALHRHTLAHIREKRFQCSTCGVKFSFETHLKEHELEAHTEIRDRPFECSICGEKFIFNCRLQAHLVVTHDGGKRFESEWKYSGSPDVKPKPDLSSIPPIVKVHPCPLCCQEFSSQHILDNHLLGHRDESNFKCDLCHCAYRGPKMLEQHIMVTHTVLGL